MSNKEMQPIENGEESYSAADMNIGNQVRSCMRCLIVLWHACNGRSRRC